MKNNSVDALFITNQNTDFHKIKKLVTRNGFRKSLFLTTHGLFQTEQKELSDLFPGSSFLIFSNLISDQEMEDCDNNATRDLLRRIDTESVKRNYNYFFIGLSLENKNRVILEKLRAMYNIQSIYYSNGLGISEKVWKNSGGIPLSDPSPRFINLGIRGISRLKWAASLFFSRAMISVIRHENKCFIFLSPTKRLNLKTPIESMRFSPFLYLLRSFPRFSYPDLVNAYLEKHFGGGKNIFISTTLHNYHYELSQLNWPLKIFVDGFHPANYPRTYIDSYISGDFVVRTMYDDHWFRKYGRNTIKPYSFLKREYFNKADTDNKSIRTVELLLNHAGDWTALINRSDTDILVQAFADTAGKLKDHQFVIRPHPTMVHPLHEGRNSLERIRKFVNNCNLNNLSISNRSLQDDFAAGDIFISEYSQTLLDIFKAGKLGIIANLTNRRSFMEDYEKLGFLAVNDTEKIYKLISLITENPIEFNKIQNNASMKYNEELNKFLQNEHFHLTDLETG